MKIVTTNHSLHNRFSVEKNIEMTANAGFNGIDFTDIEVETEVWSGGYKEYAKHLCNVADSFGIGFTQTHAPIMSSILSSFKANC